MRFICDQKFVFKACSACKPHGFGFGHHIFQNLARTQRLHAPHHLAWHQNGVFFQRQFAPQLRQQAHFQIGITCNPARQLDVVKQLVVQIPTKHHIAKRIIAFQCSQKLCCRHVFPCHHPIEVKKANLDVGNAALIDQTADVSCRLHILSLCRLSHNTTPPFEL